MADFELLAPGGHQKLVDEVVDRLDLKADIDGYYAQLTAGAADNLTGRGDATTAEFMYRTSGGTADIETGQATIKSIKGNTLVWNQQLDPYVRTTNVPNVNVTLTVEADGKVSFIGTSTSTGGRDTYVARTFTAYQNHKYLVLDTIQYDDASSSWFMTDVATSLVYKTISPNTIFTISTADATVGFGKNLVTSEHEYNLSGYVSLYDLTQMFGAGSEPSTIEEFEALFPLPYYEYDAGSLLSVNMAGIETTGFNQWDEEWELGSISDVSGNNSSSSTTIRSKNYIPVFPSTTYYTRTGGPVMVAFFYDADKNFISASSVYNPYTLTTPANAHYMRFRMSSDYGVTYENNIAINLSWSGRRNGEYEPFWSSERAIDAATYFPDGMRSAGSVYDELTSTEAIQRVGEVDSGTLTWHYNSGGYFYSSINEKAAGNYNLVCDRYETTSDDSVANMTDKQIKGHATTNSIYIKDSSFGTDEAALKASLSGVTLYYALATPTITPIEPPLNLSYRVDDFGTERIMVPEDERSATPVLDIAYGLNVVDFVRRAPTQYISAASFAQYLLARDAHDGTTTTMTWDDTDNRYEFTITDVETEG